MRLSDKHRRIIKEMEAGGYVWLSSLSELAVMRFRWRVRKGYDKFVKVEGLTFLRKKQAEELELGVKHLTEKKIPMKQRYEQLLAENDELEKEIYELKGYGQGFIEKVSKNES